MLLAKELVDDNIIRRNPAHPVEVTESGEEVPGEEVPTDGSDEDVGEEPLTAEAGTVTNTSVMCGV